MYRRPGEETRSQIGEVYVEWNETRINTVFEFAIPQTYTSCLQTTTNETPQRWMETRFVN